MMAARQELKDLAKAIEVITSLRESPGAKESELVLGVLSEAELEWRRRYMDMQSVRRPAKKKAGVS